MSTKGERESGSLVPGLTLSRLFYESEVRPILQRHVPELAYAAARIGPGSEVLGYDDSVSTDHHWGPRVQIFLRDEDVERAVPVIDRALRDELPPTFMDYSTNFGPPDELGVRLPQPRASGPIDHFVSIDGINAFFTTYLGWNPASEPSIADWLTIPEHRLLAVTSGAVFDDPAGQLGEVRAELSWYPRDLWIYLLAAGWQRIAEVEAFVGRAGDVGDDLGSRLIAARLVKDSMRLCFLMERRYAPYDKWFGTAFRSLNCSEGMLPLLEQALTESSWEDRERAIGTIASRLVAIHNALGLTAPLPDVPSPFHSRPYQVIHAERIARALYDAITDDDIRRLPPHLGSVNQLIDSTDKVEPGGLARSLRSIYVQR